MARAAGLAAATPGEHPRVLNIASGTARPVRAGTEGMVRVGGFCGRLEVRDGGSDRSSAVSWQQADIAYVDTAYGHRRTGPAPADFRRCRRWYGVDGVFLDRTASHAARPWTSGRARP